MLLIAFIMDYIRKREWEDIDKDMENKRNYPE